MKLNHHAAQDYQSLLMHQEAVRMIQADPSLAERLLKTLARWDERLSVRSKPLRDKWVEIIKFGDWAQATEESELGNQLRQASPLATVLPNEVRYAIIRKVRKLKDQQHAES